MRSPPRDRREASSTWLMITVLIAINKEVAR
jgi:hypothetical protein